MTRIISNLQAVHDAIAQAARMAHRQKENIELVAVSKGFSADAVREAHQAGQLAFGESYIQEAINKIELTRDLPLQWHFIGPVQSNKTRAVSAHFTWVHSLDRLKIAERLSKQRPSNLPPLNICIQVNVSGEDSKSGIAPEEVTELALAVTRLPQLKLRGLMTIPAPAEKPETQRIPFFKLHQLMRQINKLGLSLDTLSMGMSHDLCAAILEGATIVRIGRAIFGERIYGENQ